MTAAVTLTDVSKVYAGGVTALSGANLVVERGELTGIVGPSGSGKSTLLHLLGTLDRPSAGTVTVDGHDVSVMPDRELSSLRAGTIGFVFQQFHLAAGVRLLDNVADGLLYRGVRIKERRKRGRAGPGTRGFGASSGPPAARTVRR
jgi:putative ABC transport system ATP-binding protein